MMKLAAASLAGILALGSMTALSTDANARDRHHRSGATGAFIAGTIIGLGVGAAAASQPRYYYNDSYAYEGYAAYPEPQPYYVAPSSRPSYYSNSWCQQQGDYNAYTGMVTEAS